METQIETAYWPGDSSLELKFVHSGMRLEESYEAMWSILLYLYGNKVAHSNINYIANDDIHFIIS